VEEIAVLVSVYRNPPLRQRLGKGYVVDDPEVARRLIGAVYASGAIRVVAGDGGPQSVWFDTGFVAMHTPARRNTVFEQLAVAVRESARELRAAGAQLLPCGVRTGPAVPWSGALVGDGHALEVADEVERELITNLFRNSVPALVALTGRGGITETKVSREGSRRLAESRSHVSTRYLASTSSEHLGRVVRALRRDEGIARLDRMDVDPLGDESDDVRHVRLRFVDGSAFLATARAHAILLQAVAMQARRLRREGRRVGHVPAGLLDRNRAHAVSRGLGATFEVEEPRTAGRRRRRDAARPTPATRSEAAPSAVAGLIDGLRDELQILEATYEELAPVLSGLVLGDARELPRTEDELLRAWAREGRGPRQLASLLAQVEADTDPLTRRYEEEKPGAAGMLAEAWKADLRLLPEIDTPSLGKQLFAALDGGDQLAVDAALWRVAEAGIVDLWDLFRDLPRDEARERRRQLRPPVRHRFPASVGDGWEAEGPRTALRTAARQRRTTVVIEAADRDRRPAQRTCDQLLHAAPPERVVLLLERSTFTQDSERRCKWSLLVVSRPEGS
jgi:hypothetical protein